MLTLYSDDHRKRDAKTELCGGVLVEPFEKPSRMDYILARIKEVELGEILAPKDYGLEPILEIHDKIDG